MPLTAPPFPLAAVPQLRDTNYGAGIPGSLAEAPAARVDAVDLLRGIAMVVMMLDHTRDYIHWSQFAFDPLDLTRASTPLFLTRWITHFCAPVFVFLAGTSVYLQRLRGKSIQQLTPFLVSRGLWLIFLELTVIRLSIFYSADPRFFGFAQVIFAIGFGMIVLAAIIQLPTAAAAAIGVGIIALHNLLDGIQAAVWNGPPDPAPSLAQGIWHFFHQPGLIAPFGFPGPVAYVAYPVLPWIGVIAAGYAFGRVYEWDAARRRPWLLKLGTALTLAFVAIRATNLYGDPARWSAQDTLVRSALSFVNTTKYPPSLLFLLMTLGPAVIVLGLLDGRRPRGMGSFFATFGRVPLFFYVLQWQVAHLAGIALAVWAGDPLDVLTSTPIDWRDPGPRGFSLWVVYAVWIGGVLALYPVCRWFARLKARRRDWWLSYL